MFSSWFLTAQASIDEIRVQTDVTLSTGQLGIVVSLIDVSLKDYSGQKVWIVVKIYDKEDQDCYHNGYTDFNVTDDIANWKQVDLEILYYDLYDCIGKGIRDVYIICYLNPDSAEDETEMIPGSYKYIQMKIFFQYSDPVKNHS